MEKGDTPQGGEAAALRSALAAERARREEAERDLAKARDRIGTLELVVEKLPLAFFLVTPDHRIAELNGATEKIAGMPRERILREGCFGLFCDHRAHFEKCPGHASFFTGEDWDGKAVVGGRHYDVSVRPLRRGGEIPYSLVALSDCTENDAQRDRIAEIVPRLERNIANSVRIRERLAEFATVSDPVRIINSALEEAARLLHATSLFLMRLEPGGTYSRIHSWFRAPQFDRVPVGSSNKIGIFDVLRDRREFFYVVGQKEGNIPSLDKFIAESGAQRGCCASLSLDGKVWGAIGFLSDIDSPATEDDVLLLRETVFLVEIALRRSDLLHVVEREKRNLVAATKAAQAASRAKSTFLATMSHEIRTPLNAMVGFGEMLCKPDLRPEKALEYAAALKRASNALLTLVNDVLDLSKMESESVDMNGSCDLVRLFEDVASVFAWRTRDKKLDLVHEIPPDFPLLHLSEARMRQILLNLVGNGIKFTEEGFVKWTAAAKPDGDGTASIEIVVSDSGCGIAPDKRKSVFDPFVQDIPSRGGLVYAGTGLGLTIVRRLLSAVGGSISLESEPGKGSSFTVKIPGVKTIDRPKRPRADATSPVPVPTPVPVPVPVPVPASAPAQASAKRPSLALPPGFSVVIADDISVNLRIMALLLKDLGVKDIREFSGGRPALEGLKARPASAVFTDVWMPDGNGAELAKAVREDPALAATPVIAVTADHDVAASFDVSVFDSIVEKPVSSEKILACLRTFAAKADPRSAPAVRPSPPTTRQPCPCHAFS